LNVRTSLGVIGVEFTPDGVTRIHLRPMPVAGTPVPEFVRQLARALRDYAAGAVVRFDVPLDLPGTPFQRAVWRSLPAIPAGETRSYAWVAKRIGRPRAARAVGAACGANPVPILVPCHRVVRADGALGGFSAGAGWKRRLLNVEKRHTG
jgi:O-6-methylguanine DNA methyltransferase